MGVPDPQGKGRFGGLNHQPKHVINRFQLTEKMIYDSPGGSIDQRFRLLRKHFGRWPMCAISVLLLSGI